MGDINPLKMPNGKKKKRRDDTDFESFANGGLWANINAKRKRGEKMRKPGSRGAPTDQAFIDSAKTSKS